jgi:8-oxo-dGTP pyrophosphatase MutT (NUDIX family)
MANPKLLEVPLANLTKFELKEKLRKLSRSAKQTVFFLQSTNLTKANRDPGYRQVLSNSSYNLIENFALHFCFWAIQKRPILPKLHAATHDFWLVFRVAFFGLLFIFQWPLNLILVIFTRLLSYNFSGLTLTQTMPAKVMVWDLLKLAEEKNWKTLVLGGSKTSDEVTRDLILRLFPKLNLITWPRETNSLLSQDKIDPENINQVLTSDNICQLFPELYEAKKFIQDKRPDVILTSLSGESGKQEYFLRHLQLDPDIDFAFAAGLGNSLGLTDKPETNGTPRKIWLFIVWLWRYSVNFFSLIWWTSVQQFMTYGLQRPTVINIVRTKPYDNAYAEPKPSGIDSIQNGGSSQEALYLLVERKNWLPGDIGWTFVQGQVEKDEEIAIAGLREVKEEAGLLITSMRLLREPVPSETENYTVSLGRYVLMGAKYSSSRKYLNFVEYLGHEAPKANWENRAVKWVGRYQVKEYLSPEKRSDWAIAKMILGI